MNNEFWNGISLNESEQNLLEFMNSDIDNALNDFETLKESLVESSILNEGVADMYLVESIKDKAKEVIKKLKEFFKKIIDWISQKVRGHKMELMVASQDKKDDDNFIIIKTISGKVIKKIKIESDKGYYVTLYNDFENVLSDLRKKVKETEMSDEALKLAEIKNLYKIGSGTLNSNAIAIINKQLKSYNKVVESIYNTSKFSLKELNKEKDSVNKGRMKIYNQIRKLISSSVNFKNIIKVYDSDFEPSNVSASPVVNFNYLT